MADRNWHELHGSINDGLLWRWERSPHEVRLVYIRVLADGAGEATIETEHRAETLERTGLVDEFHFQRWANAMKAKMLADGWTKVTPET